jgi:hypothetical protein
VSFVFLRTLWCRGYHEVRQKKRETRVRGCRHVRVQRTPRWGRKCTRLRPPRAEHCSLVKKMQIIVQEEEDPGSEGDPEMKPGQEQPPGEGGLESGHRSRKQREPTPSKPEGTPLTLKPVSISQIRPTIRFMV